MAPSKGQAPAHGHSPSGAFGHGGYHPIGGSAHANPAKGNMMANPQIANMGAIAQNMNPAGKM
jgi:hypothetical protein